MTGLIKYDLMQIASGVKGGFVLVYLIFVAVLSVVGEMGGMFSYIIVFLGVMFGIAAFNYEESYHWDRYTAALPVSVRQIVLARYIMVGICLLAGLAAGVLLSGISFAAGNLHMALGEWMVAMAQTAIVAVLYVEIMIPVMYRFGAERGRIAMLILFFVLWAAAYGIISLVEAASAEQLAILSISLSGMTLIGAVVVLALLPVSIGISARIRSKKEF